MCFILGTSITFEIAESRASLRRIVAIAANNDWQWQITIFVPLCLALLTHQVY